MLSRVKRAVLARAAGLRGRANRPALRTTLAAAAALTVMCAGVTVGTQAPAEASYYLHKRCHNNGIRLHAKFLVGDGQARYVVYHTVAVARYRYKSQNPDFYFRWPNGLVHKAGRWTERTATGWRQKAKFRKNVNLGPGGKLRVTALKQGGGGCSVVRTAPS